MCWSEEVSLSTFIIGWTLSLILIFRNKTGDRIFGFFFLWVTFMQFLEYLMWIDQSCKKGINNIASQMSWFQNLMQPFIWGILIIIYIYVGKNLKEKNSKSLIPLQVLIAGLTIYIIAFIIWIFKEKPYKDKMCTVPCKKCKGHHLDWPWTKNKYGSYIWIFYFIGIALMILSSIKNKSGRLLSVYLIITCIIAASFMPFNKAMGSWWCIFAVGGPLLKLLIPPNFLKN